MVTRFPSLDVFYAGGIDEWTEGVSTPFSEHEQLYQRCHILGRHRSLTLIHTRRQRSR